MSDVHILEIIAGLLLFVFLPFEWMRMRRARKELKRLEKGDRRTGVR